MIQSPSRIHQYKNGGHSPANFRDSLRKVKNVNIYSKMLHFLEMYGTSERQSLRPSK